MSRSSYFRRSQISKSSLLAATGWAERLHRTWQSLRSSRNWSCTAWDSTVRLVVPGLSDSVVATENGNCCCAGPPLQETLQLLTPLTNLEVLDLGFNQLGGNITAEVAAFIKLKQLGLARMGLKGKSLSTRPERFIFATEIDVAFYAGPLPKVLPISLEVFNLGDSFGNTNKFTGGIPSEWGALTNLKELKMVACGLDGKPLRTRTERFMFSEVC